MADSAFKACTEAAADDVDTDGAADVTAVGV